MSDSPVTLFSDGQFGGATVPLDEGDSRFPADFNDTASSVRVAPGYCAVLYEHANEHGGYGASVDLLEDCPDLSVYGFDKKTSYVSVFRTERPDGFVWARCATRDGQVVPGHWERKRARGGSDLNSGVAVVAAPIPPPSAPSSPGVVVRDHRGEVDGSPSGGVTVHSGVDRALCPIPPGFKVIGDIVGRDAFEHFKTETGYGGWSGRTHGFSNRWRNPTIRSANIVCGFQFKIGPALGWRWRWDNDKKVQVNLGVVDSGDVSLFFPRQHSIDNWEDFIYRDRGNYLVMLKWYESTPTHDGLFVEAGLDKEYPHGSYGGMNHFTSEPHWFQSRPNPRPPLAQIRDGQWHSFLGVIYNDWHRRSTHVTSGNFPIMGLWYSPVPTHNFNDFIFLGMGVDKDNMNPSPVLGYGVEDSNKTIGDHLLAEHPLQIRIDDVPTDQVEIRNVYAANVEYVGETVLPDTALCSAEAAAVADARTAIERLEERLEEARRNVVKRGEGFDESDPWLQIVNSIIDVELPNARADLSTAMFEYGECKKRHDDIPIVVSPISDPTGGSLQQ